MNAIAPTILAAKAKGVKLSLYHGWQIPRSNPSFTVQLNDKIAEANGWHRTTPRIFSVLFMVPGNGALAHSGLGR